MTTRAIDLLRYFSWAGSVGTSLASQSSHLNTASFFYLLGLSSFSLFPTLLLCFDFLNFILFVSSAVSSFLYYLLQIRFVRTRFSSFELFVVVEYLQQQYREHSKAQRNHPCTKQQTKYIPIRVHTSNYQKKYVRTTCMQRPGCFPGAWSSWHL